MRECGDWIDAYIKLTENTEPPLLFHKWVAISAIAACMQRKCVLPMRLDQETYPNLYIILVAPPGVARKSTSMAPVMRMLEEPRLGIRLAAESLTREQLIRELEASVSIINIDGGMLSHTSLTICNSEIAVFLGYNNIQLLNDLSDWYDCKRRWGYHTKNSGSNDITNLWVNILGATTPDLLRTTLPLEVIGGGLASRMIFVYAARKRRAIPDSFVPPEDLILRDRLVNDLERIVTMQGTFRVSSEYIGTRAEWYMLNDENPPFDDKNFTGYCSRRMETVTKLSMIMHASYSDDMILQVEDFERAVAYIEEVEQLMPMALSGLGAGKYADVIHRVMEDVQIRKEITLEELMYKYRHDVTKWDLDRVLESLDAMGMTDLINGNRLVLRESFNQGRKRM